MHNGTLKAAPAANCRKRGRAAAKMSTLRLLLIVDENLKKVVNVLEDIEAKKLQELAATSFAMDSEVTGLKCYDKDFEEWVLIPEDFVPTDKERLHAIPMDIVRKIYLVYSCSQAFLSLNILFSA